MQQKLAAKSLAELQRNVTASAAELASEVAALAAQLAKVCAKALVQRSAKGFHLGISSASAALVLGQLCSAVHAALSTGLPAAGHVQLPLCIPDSPSLLPLVQVQQDGSALDALVLARVEALVDSRLQRMSQDIAALQAAAAASATRELAVTCLLGMLGAAVVLSVPSRGLGGALLRWAVALLALGNGTLSLLLQYRSGVGIASVLQSLAR